MYPTDSIAQAIEQQKDLRRELRTWKWPLLVTTTWLLAAAAWWLLALIVGGSRGGVVDLVGSLFGLGSTVAMVLLPLLLFFCIGNWLVGRSQAQAFERALCQPQLIRGVGRLQLVGRFKQFEYITMTLDGGAQIRLQVPDRTAPQIEALLGEVRARVIRA